MRKNTTILTIIIGVLTILYLGTIIDKKIEENKFLSNPNLNPDMYHEIVDILTEKDIYKFRSNSGWVEINGTDIDYDQREASIEGSPLAIESIDYEEALNQFGFTEEELLALIDKINSFGFTKVGLITNQIAPEKMTLYGFCSNDECYRGVIYSIEGESINSVKEAIRRTLEIEIVPTTNPNLYLFASNDEYWL